MGLKQETMKNKCLKFGLTSPKQPSWSYSLVGLKIPFIGTIVPHITAFVGKKMPSVAHRHNHHGFTLIELMVTLAVIAIILAIAVPNMRTLIQNGRLSTQSNDFISDITFARSEAIKRGNNVVICPATVATACSGGSNWENGRLIFVDANNDSAWGVGDIPLRFRESLGGANTQRAAGGLLTFDRRGLLVAGSPTSFRLCDERLVAYGRVITLTTTGQVRVEPKTTLPASCP